MGALILLLATFIWGTAFLAQKFGSESLGPFAVTCFRNILGGFFLTVCILIRNRRKATITPNSTLLPPNSIVAGLLCGIPLFAAMAAQQIGIGYTTPGISGFLTTNYMFFIPILAFTFYRRLPRLHVCGGIVLAIAGTYLICLSSETGSSATLNSSLFALHSMIGPGELWTILCAFLFAVQMMVVDRYAKRCDVLVMSASQLFTAAILSAPFMLLPSELSLLRNCSLLTASSSLPIVYLGVFSSGIAYTLQNFGQARTPPAVAGVVLSMESVFAALSGFVVLGDRMTGAQFVGCVMVFIAAISTQIFDIIFEKKPDVVIQYNLER